LTDATGIELVLSGVERLNSIGPGERDHGPLRTIFQKARYEYPNINPDVSLRLAVKALNDTMNPEGLVPSYLVFGILPRFPALNSELPTQVDKMKKLESARAEMETITSELRVRRALSANITTASTKSYLAGQKVLVYWHNVSLHRVRTKLQGLKTNKFKLIEMARRSNIQFLIPNLTLISSTTNLWIPYIVCWNHSTASSNAWLKCFSQKCYTRQIQEEWMRSLSAKQKEIEGLISKNT
jgi:hypothetical protein